MRSDMLAQPFTSGVFIGGMDGVKTEFNMLQQAQSGVKLLAVPSTGGAASEIAQELGQINDRIDFARLFPEQLGVGINEARNFRL